MARRIPNRKGGAIDASKLLKRRNRRGKQNSIKDGLIIPIDSDRVLMERVSGIFKMNGFRYGDYLHVSDLIGKCMRMIALSYRTESKIHGETLYDNLGITFAIGDSIHDYVKAKAIKNNPEEVYGRWQCYCGKTEVVGTYNQAISKKECPDCGELPSKYEELLLVNEEYKIIGAVDLAHIIDGSLYLSEIKSIKHENWEGLERPLSDHILQILFYWWLAKEAGYSLHQQVSILYVTKGFVFGKSPFKEFVLDPQNYIKRLDDYKEEAMSLKISREGGKLPYKVCNKPKSPTAKKCEMCSICFNWKD